VGDADLPVYRSGRGYYAVIILMLGGIISYIISPQFVQCTASKVGSVIPGGWFQLGPQARFVNLEGDVRVRKENAEWEKADLRTNLDRGDYIETGNNGMARISFDDGTAYSMKPDTMIVIKDDCREPAVRRDHINFTVRH